MNYTECFNGSRVDGLQIVCSPFFVVAGVSMLARMEYYARVSFCARPGASMLAWMEYYARVPFAPVLVPTLLRYTYYSTSQILEFLPPCSLLAACYRYYRSSQSLGNCE